MQPRYRVQLMLGDYHMDNQPHWQRDMPLAEAIAAAQETWVWFWRLPAAKNVGFHEVCVFVYDAANDELCDNPVYVQGNPRCDEPDPPVPAPRRARRNKRC